MDGTFDSGLNAELGLSPDLGHCDKTINSIVPL